MSHFYGVLQGRRSDATRTGAKSSGMTTHAAGWKGAIRVTLRHDEALGIDRYEVDLIPWQGSGGKVQCIAEGVLDANLTADVVKA